MKIQHLAAGLAVLLLLSSTAASGFTVWYVWSARQNLKTQAEVARLNNISAGVRSLLGDSMEYSKHNPAIVPLLQQWNLLPKTNPAPPASGAIRSPSR